MVGVFKTNVESDDAARRLCTLLVRRFPDARISFDLEDCDRVLRIEHWSVCSDTAIDVLQQAGYACAELED